MNFDQDFEILNGVLCRYCGFDTEVIVPEGVCEIKNMAFAENKNIRKVFLPRGVTRIGEGAFRNCENLEEIHLPEELLVIDHRAFCGCENLMEVHFPKNLKSIGERAFSGCRGLEDLSLPESVQSIGEFIFSNCKALTFVRLPSGLTKIPKYAFYNCSSLIDVQLPASLQSIEKEAFSYTQNITLRLPEGLQTIASHAFESTRNFFVIFPEHFTSVPKYLFDFAGDYEIFAPNVPFSLLTPRDRKAAVAGYVKAPDDMLALLPKEEEAQYLAYLKHYRRKYYPRIEKNEALLVKMIEHTLIPYEETEELIDLFQGRPDLVAMLLTYRQSIRTPELEKKLQRKKERTEERLFNLEPPTVSEMKKEWAFDLLENDTCILRSYKGNATEIVVPGYIGRYKVVAIADQAFSPFARRISERQEKTRKAITSVIVPETVETLGKSVFLACGNLQTVVLPKNIKILDENVFAHCDKLASVRLPENLESILSLAFLNCAKLTELILPDWITEITPSSFGDCYQLTLKAKAKTVTQSYLETVGIPHEIID